MFHHTFIQAKSLKGLLNIVCTFFQLFPNTVVNMELFRSHTNNLNSANVFC